MQNVDPATREFRQHDVAINHDVLGHRGHAAEAKLHAHEPLVHNAALGELEYLGVDQHSPVEHLAVFECSPHDLSGIDGSAIIGERHGFAFHQSTQFGQFFALAVLGHGSDWKYVAKAC